jgi:gas vesicle protein
LFYFIRKRSFFQTPKNIYMKRTTLIALGLIGVAVALAFTTDKGKEYRDDVARGSKKLSKRLRKQAKVAGMDVAEFAASLVGQMAGFAHDARDKGQDLVDDGTDATKSALKGLRKRFSWN